MTDGYSATVILHTQRLDLVPGTIPLVDAALAGRAELGEALGATVPASWPPEFLDDAAFAWIRGKLAEPETSDPAWWMYFVVARDPDGSVLVGTGGYKGAPDATGTVEIGYGIVADRRRRGLASEIANALIAQAFADPRVRRVIAETLPELEGSLGVLRVCGFLPTDGASEPGTLRFELLRDAWARRPGQPRA